LNRLSPNAFSLLAGGAVLEQRLTFERLCAISNVSEDLALPALDELISGRLLLETVHPGVTGAYAFTNDMLRDVVYTEAGDARRRLFHQRALKILEAAGDSAAVLAHHALAAGLAGPERVARGRGQGGDHSDQGEVGSGEGQLHGCPGGAAGRSRRSRAFRRSTRSASTG
jgi:hypothetical protein